MCSVTQRLQVPKNLIEFSVCHSSGPFVSSWASPPPRGVVLLGTFAFVILMVKFHQLVMGEKFSGYCTLSDCGVGGGCGVNMFQEMFFVDRDKFRSSYFPLDTLSPPVGLVLLCN